ncbi:MAG: (Fe-S)-binding protein [Planctomycetes bacterium]|nr:(Fe-S)-binding protein [Planctomycetota bacterium]
MCRFACPVAEATKNERHTPWGKQAALYEVRRARQALDRETARTFHACLGCHGSVSFCLHGIDVPAELFRARAEAVSSGVYRPAPWVPARLAASGTPFPGSPRERQAELLPHPDPGAAWLLFPGCAGLAGEGDDVRAAARLATLSRPGGYRTTERVFCGGYPLAALGYASAFEEHRARLSAALAGADRILSLCPACLPILRAAAPTGALVIHPLTLAARLMEEGKINPSKPFPGRAAYHDPCHLARDERLGPPARRVLAGVFERGLAEFLWNGVETRCAGGGGGLPATYPRASWRILEARLEEFDRTGAEALVTSCSNCLRRFRRARPGGIVLDAMDALLRAAEILEPGPGDGVPR